LRAQAISNLAWSFATVGIDARAAFDAIETSILERRLDDFKPQEVANLAWAFSKAGLDGDFNDESPGADKRHIHTTGFIIIIISINLSQVVGNSESKPNSHCLQV
jgi:hypothetical protein